MRSALMFTEGPINGDSVRWPYLGSAMCLQGETGHLFQNIES